MKKKNLKGQSLIFEQVLLFSMSVTVFIISFAVFNIYQGYFLSVGGENQLDQVKEWVSANILKLAEKGTAGTSSVTIPIPRTIENTAYTIELSSADLTVKTTVPPVKTKISTLYSLNSYFTFSPAKVPSVNGKITIKKENNQIIIT